MAVSYVIELDGKEEGFWTGKTFQYQQGLYPVVTDDKKKAKSYKSVKRAINAADKALENFP